MHNINFSCPFILKFCTEHSSITAVLCAKISKWLSKWEISHHLCHTNQYPHMSIQYTLNSIYLHINAAIHSNRKPRLLSLLMVSSASLCNQWCWITEMSPHLGNCVDCFTVPTWRLLNCHWGVRHGLQISWHCLLWLDDLNIVWEWLSYNVFWCHVTGENFHRFSKATDSPLAQP